MRRSNSNEHSIAMIFCQEADFDESIIGKDLNEFSELFLAGDHVAADSEPRESDVGPSEAQTTDEASAGPVESMYVAKLKEMIDTVLAHEAHLFSPSELELLHRIKTIDCVQQFILARLVQRKRGKWHRADHLASSYTQDLVQYMMIPEDEVAQRMYQALVGLCANWRLGAQSKSSVPDEKEVIDLTLDSDDDDEITNAFSPKHTTVQSTPADATANDWTMEPRSFAEDTHRATPSELLECLTRDELVLMSRRLKIPNKTKQTRPELIKAILASSSTQTTLPFSVVTKPSAASLQKSKNTLKQLFQSKPPTVAGKTQNMRLQERRVRDMCGEIFGGCLRLHDEVFQVLHLVNLVYFRSTQYSDVESILLSAILSTAKKRNYPKYTYLRTPGVFKTRTDLLRYMECLQILGRIDDILGEGPTGLPKGAKIDRLTAAQEVIEIWKGEWDRWNSLVAYIKDKPPCEPWLERFEEGHVLTRLVYKAAYCFGLLKDFSMELKIRTALLRQTRWRRGRRGSWYDRMALIHMTHMGGGDANLKKARDILLEGLEDKLVHLGSRPKLAHRLKRLEKKLCIPPEEQYVGDELRTSFERRIEGVRIFTPPQPIISIKRTSTPNLTTAKVSNTSADHHSSVVSGVTDTKAQRPQWKGKSVWAGKEGEVNVETFALEYYATLGFKGVHAEGRITSTLFGILLWDILFAPVPGAFETPYQSAPLDLFHDSFITARQEIIDARLAELVDDEGAARRIIEEVDTRERENATWCVGVRWDLFERDDLLDIADCLGGRALATICRLLAEEYGNRGGGVPDLFIWNPAEKTCKFVEVKGPGDNLSDTQKVWIDALLSAGIDVEVCRVYELGKIPARRPTKASKKGKAQPRRRSVSKGGASKSRKPAHDDSEKEEPESEDELWSSSEDERATTEPTAAIGPGNIATSTKLPTSYQETSNLPLPSEPIHNIEPHGTSSHLKDPAPPRPTSPALTHASVLGKRDAAEAELDTDTDKAADQMPKKNRARAAGSPTPVQRNTPDLVPSKKDTKSGNRTTPARTPALKSESSMGPPILPSATPEVKAEPLSPTTPSVINSASRGSFPLTQETVVPETPPPPSRHERLMGSSGPRVTITHSSKQWRDALQVTPVRKKRKENEPGPKSPIAVTALSTPKRKRKDPPTHTPAPISIPTIVLSPIPISLPAPVPTSALAPPSPPAPTPVRPPISTAIATPAKQASSSKGKTIATSRTPRTRAATSSERAALAASPLEWEKRWPDVFPHWVGGVDADSDPDYEPSQ